DNHFFYRFPVLLLRRPDPSCLPSHIPKFQAIPPLIFYNQTLFPPEKQFSSKKKTPSGCLFGEFPHLLQKHIGFLFFPNGGRRPMPRQDHHIIPQRKQFYTNAVNNLLKAAPGKVCTTDRSFEQGIPG